MCLESPKSLVQAAKVGVLNPQEIPKKIAEMTKVKLLGFKTKRNIPILRKTQDHKITGALPYLSDDFEKKNRTTIEAMV